MVRIKERYLLINLLYPEGPRDPSQSKLPDLLVYNQPTTNTFNGRAFAQAIKTEVAKLFGDYGAGAVERALRGLLFLFLFSFAHIFIGSPTSFPKQRSCPFCTI